MLTSSSSVTLIRRHGNEETFRMFRDCGLDAIDYPVDGGTPDLEALKREGIHTALDTCGFAPWTEYEKVLPWTDLVLFDVKAASKQLDEWLREDFGAFNI